MNKTVQSMAYKSLRFKLQKAKELGIKDLVNDQELEELAVKLAQEKLNRGDTDKTLEELVKGQEWYLNHLKHLLSLSPAEALQEEYSNLVADFGEESDMLSELEKLYS